MFALLVLPFQCLQPSDGIWLLATRQGLVRLDHPSVFCAAEELAAQGWGTVLSNEKLQQILTRHTGHYDPKVEAFLIEISVLRQVSSKFSRYSRLRLLMRRENVPGLGTLIDDLSYFTGLETGASLDATGFCDGDFVVVYADPYDSHFIDLVQTRAKAMRNAAVMTAYFAARTLVIDSPYLPLAGTPCHFCQSAAASQVRNQGSAYSPTWSDVLRDLHLKPGVIDGLEHPVKDTDHLIALGVLRNRVRELLGPHREHTHSRLFLESSQFHLDGFDLHRQTPPITLDCDKCG